jgi:hypothetical protein
MNTEISHLTVTAAALLNEADNQRIRAIRSRRWLVVVLHLIARFQS